MKSIQCLCGKIIKIPADKILGSFCSSCGESFERLFLIQQHKLGDYFEEEEEEEKEVVIEKKYIPIEIANAFLEEFGPRFILEKTKLKKVTRQLKSWADIEKYPDVLEYSISDNDEKEWITGDDTTLLGMYDEMRRFESLKEYFEDTTTLRQTISYKLINNFLTIMIRNTIISTERLRRILRSLARGVANYKDKRPYYTRNYNITFITKREDLYLIYIYIGTAQIKGGIIDKISYTTTPVSILNLMDHLLIPDEAIGNIILSNFDLIDKNITDFKFNITKLYESNEEEVDIENSLNIYMKIKLLPTLKKGVDLEILDKSKHLYNDSFHKKERFDDVPDEVFYRIYNSFFIYTYNDIINKKPHKEYIFLISKIIQQIFKFDIKRFKVERNDLPSFNTILVNIIFNDPASLADNNGIAHAIFNEKISEKGDYYKVICKLIIFLYNSKFTAEESIMALKYRNVFPHFSVKKISIEDDEVKPIKSEIKIGSKASHQYNIILDYNEYSMLTNLEMGNRLQELRDPKQFNTINYTQFIKLIKEDKKIEFAYNTEYFKRIIKSLFTRKKQRETLIIRYRGLKSTGIKKAIQPVLAIIYKNVFIYLAGYVKTGERGRSKVPVSLTHYLSPRRDLGGPPAYF
ncbi:MAG: hypothetical protein GF317_09950 [Candidatus Lokiarchaeota archaeon]|nr:hypothetical protein [Candidatus Lokiarchaeota archaeon]